MSQHVRWNRFSRPLISIGIWFRVCLAVIAEQGEVELNRLFDGRPPDVFINQFEPSLESNWGGTPLSYLSMADGVAVTVSETVSGEDFAVTGTLLIWDLSGGRLSQAVALPARITAIGGVRGSGRIVAAGGPVNKDSTSGFVVAVDLGSGQVVTEFVPRHESGQDLNLRFSEDGDWAVLRDGEGFDDNGELTVTHVAYHLGNGATEGVPVNVSDWDLLEPLSSQIASASTGLPNWLETVGDIDGMFALAADLRGPGLWRTDTWERITRLGEFSSPWQNWAVAPDGLKLVSWRAGVAGGLTLWDLNTFRVKRIEEPGFRPELAPAFSHDGEWLRYKRRDSKSGEIEIISRNLRDDSTQIAQRLPADDFSYFPDSRIHGVFSAEGSHLLIANGPDSVSRITWDLAGRPTTVKVPVTGKRPLSIASDGSTGAFAVLRVPGEDLDFPVHLVNLKSGKTLRTWNVTTVGHEPHFASTHHPATGETALSHFTSGPSLGYYGGDVVNFAPRGLQRVPGYLAGADAAPPSNGAHAWSLDFMNLAPGQAPLLAIYSSNGHFRTWDLVRQTFVHDYQWEKFNPEIYAAESAFPLFSNLVATNGGRAFLPLRDGGIGVIALLADGTVARLADLWSLPGNGWFAVTPEGYYACSVGSERHVYFRIDGRIHPFDQFDAFLNRPDRVAEALGAFPGEVEGLLRAHNRRLTALGIEDSSVALDTTSVPRLEVEGDVPLIHDGESLSITVTGYAQGDASLERLNVSANDVPVFGAKGKSLVKARKIGEIVSIPLEPGENILRVSVSDSRGLESVAQELRVHRSARGEQPDLYLFMVGTSDYGNDEYDLDFCAKDARDLTETLEKASVGFGQIRKKIIVDSQATRKGILGAGDFLQSSRPGDRVIVFFAGHAVLDSEFHYFFGPHDMDFDNPSARGLSFADLESLIDGIPARERLILVDTCHAGAVDAGLLDELQKAEAKATSGQRTAVPFDPVATARNQRFVEELFVDLRRGTGATVLSAARGLESAEESSEWSNGVFTFSVIDALRNQAESDRNRDQILFVSEMLDYASSTVVRLTAGRQHPNIRSQNLAVDFPVAMNVDPCQSETPESFLRRYLIRMSCDSGRLPVPLDRVLAMFADRVTYFGKVMSSAELRAELETDHAHFFERYYTANSIGHSDISNDGQTAVIDYEMAFRLGYLDASNNNASKEGLQKMRIRLVRGINDWRITAVEER